MIPGFYYFGIFLATAVALSDWRKGLVMCLLLDALRDPLRKLAPGQPVLFTVVVAVVWFGAFAGLCSRSPRLSREMFLKYGGMRAAVLLVVAAVLPAAALVVGSFGHGWKLAILGGVSYLAPFMGIVVGFAYARTPRDITRFLAVYCVATAVVLSGTLLELAGWKSALVGGLIGTEWTRHLPGHAVQLVSGFFRSPDVMGLHAASVSMYGTVLAVQAPPRRKWWWIGLVVFAAFCLLVSGRRKMIGMPLLFFLVYLLLLFRRGSARMSLALGAVAVATVPLLAWIVAEANLSESYLFFAGTTIDDSTQRLQKNVFGAAVGTVRQVGVFGVGLGAATQGAQYFSAAFSKRAAGGLYIWQEDGLSRLVVELGVIGTLCVLAAGLCILWSIAVAVRRVRPGGPAAALGAGLAASLIAHLGSFTVSHQAYSGDPSTVFIVSATLGLLLATADPRKTPNPSPSWRNFPAFALPQTVDCRVARFRSSQ